MATQHTPGPLTISGPSPGRDRDIDDGGDYAILDSYGHIIGQAHRLVAPGTFMPAEANATLWAAAPQLLEALEWAMPFCPIPKGIEPTAYQEAYRTARAAIEAAKGTLDA